MKELIKMYKGLSSIIYNYEFSDYDEDMLIQILDMINFLILKEVEKSLGE